uniref:Uncharacterized protein n=1 Tax=Podoviridae sp. ct9R41 TaxID=2825227 RepID=A0A8S5P8L7_9CAUD|nr:MAG TPA: hypothetical protein [Podoviridae sp. ct9R41]
MSLTSIKKGTLSRQNQHRLIDYSTYRSKGRYFFTPKSRFKNEKTSD